MKRTLFAAALSAMALMATSATAQDDMVDPMQDAPADVVMECCCCDSGGWIFGAEATFFKFLDSNGVNDFGGFALANRGRFDYEVNPRLTLGYAGCDGLGMRVRYWQYDENTLSNNGNVISVDTYTIDFEVFQCIDLGSCTSVEISGGIRYNEFDMFREGVVLDGNDSFQGFGGIVAIEANRQLNCNWSAYGRFRQVILSDDFFANQIGNDSEFDGIRDVTEVALGINYHGCRWTLNAGYEWHLWSNYTRGTSANLDIETSDVGFAGFVLGAELSY